MGHYKNIETQSNGLVTIDEAPIQRIDKDEITAAVNRMRAIVPNGERMSIPSLTIIAQEAILYRIVPGRDMHYYEGKNGLVRIPDYKYLKNFSSFKEQLLSGDDTATVEDNYRVLDDTEKIKHSIAERCTVAECRLTTKRERRAFAAEVRQWIEMGFTSQEAVSLARETYGEIGTTAVGVWDPEELDRWGKPITPPKGWTPLQVAEKLAFKNAMNRKYGIPTADEMSAMAHRMARRAMPEHWKPEHTDKPIDVQARLADLEAQAEAIHAEAETMTPEEKRERRQNNVEAMRGPANAAIGEEPEIDHATIDAAAFFERVADGIPYYKHATHAKNTLNKLGLEYDAENEEMLFDELAKYASRKADESAAQVELPM